MAPAQSLIATANPPNASRSKKLLGSSRMQICESVRSLNSMNTCNQWHTYLRIIPQTGGNDELDFLSYDKNDHRTLNSIIEELHPLTTRQT